MLPLLHIAAPPPLLLPTRSTPQERQDTSTDSAAPAVVAVEPDRSNRTGRSDRDRDRDRDDRDRDRDDRDRDRDRDDRDRGRDRGRYVPVVVFC